MLRNKLLYNFLDLLKGDHNPGAIDSASIKRNDIDNHLFSSFNIIYYCLVVI